MHATSDSGHEHELDVRARELVRDLHAARPAVFWTDLLLSAAIGWGAFLLACRLPAWSASMIAAIVVSALALYRCLCFTHEITHLRRDALPGFETAWNLIAGVALLFPSFAYVGVHQSHHHLSTYGTKDDPEYLPFASSRRMIGLFALQSAFVLPVLLFVRFVVLAPLGLLVPALHRGLEAHASSFSMNPAYRRTMSAAAVRSMRRWEFVIWGAWMAVLLLVWTGAIPNRVVWTWLAVMILGSFLNTLRVLGAHDYDSDGAPIDRYQQLADSIDTPGGPWTELWAPVGLRYHALHHYFPGIPYHNLGVAYRRLISDPEHGHTYEEHSSASLRASLAALYGRATRRRVASPAPDPTTARHTGA